MSNVIQFPTLLDRLDDPLEHAKLLLDQAAAEVRAARGEPAVADFGQGVPEPTIGALPDNVILFRRKGANS